MIVLNNIGLNSDATSIEVAITIPFGESYSTARLWTSDMYKTTSGAIDIKSYFPGGAQFATNNLSIPVSAIGETTFNGVFYIEITTAIGELEGSTTEFAISNLTVYNTCILDKVLQVDIIDCVPTVTTDCQNLVSSQITFINTMLESLEYALLQGDLLSAQYIELQLQKLCTDDCGCTQTENAVYLTGTYLEDDVVVSGIFPIIP